MTLNYVEIQKYLIHKVGQKCNPLSYFAKF